MQKLTYGMLIAVFGVGCATESDGLTSFELSKGATDFEPTWTDHQQCWLNFAGGVSPNQDQYLIWNVGANGVVDAPYDTPERADLWAVFGTNASADQIHHVDGWDPFDHYHVAEAYPGVPGYNATYDVITAWPGPNYNAASYVTAKNKAELHAQLADGQLVRLTLPEIGFPPLVLFAPIACLTP